MLYDIVDQDRMDVIRTRIQMCITYMIRSFTPNQLIEWLSSRIIIHHCIIFLNG